MTEDAITFLFAVVLGIAAITFYEIVRATILILRSKFIPTYHIEVLCAQNTAWWYWQIIQTQDKGGNYKFTYREAVEFKAKESNETWGDNMRIVRAQ